MAISIALAFPAAALAADETSFYKDKTISMVVGYGPGTGNDLFMRAVQRHIGQHLPGQPQVIPVNMPGAASLTMLNYIANAAPRDGTVIGMPSRSLVTEPLLGNEQARFDGTKLSWIGSATKDVSVCMTWSKSDIRSLDDAKKRDVLLGATGYAADSNMFPLLINEAAGTRLKPLLGYADSGAVGIAMEQGELDGYCGFTVSAIKSAHPQWLEQKQINIIIQISPTGHPDLKGVPLIFDFVKNDAQRATFDFAFAPQEMGRPVVAPPDIPADRLAALRKAFDDTMKDPEFLADAKRSGLEILEPMSGEAVAQLVAKLYATPAAAIQHFRDLRDRRN
jgi:tripartite-type tricarboxylate transporter receptor subunit TctC